MFDPTIHILSTRPLSVALINTAAAAGIYIDVIPFIATAPVEDTALSQRLAQLGEQALTVIFTSANAVEAVARHTGGNKEWTVFCIGAATRRSVEKYFGEAKIACTADSALGLAEEIIRWRAGEGEGGDSGGHAGTGGKEAGGDSGIFFFCGDLRREELPVALQGAGLRVHELVVYRTAATPQIVEGGYAGVLFFSPSAVESFFSMNAVAPVIPLFAIGKTTATAIREYNNNPIVIPPKPDTALLIQQVIDHFEIKK